MYTNDISISLLGEIKDTQARRQKFSRHRSNSSASRSIATLDDSSEDDDDECGIGILEFSPEMAGRDVTPAPEILRQQEELARSGMGVIPGGVGTFSAIAGIGLSSESEGSMHGKQTVTKPTNNQPS